MNLHLSKPNPLRAGARRRAHRRLLLAGALAALFLLPPGTAASQAPQAIPEIPELPDRATAPTPESKPGVLPGRALVKAETGPDYRELERVNRRLGTNTEEAFPALDLKVVEFDPGRPVGEVLAAYRRDPAVEYAEPDLLRRPAAPNDPRFGAQWGLANTGQSVARSPGVPGADVGALSAWDAARGDSVVVALVDTGVNVDHPDLAQNVWVNPGEIPNDGEDNDNNGYADDVNGWNFHDGNADLFDEFDGEEHGTHTAGTVAAAADNGEGVAGVAPAARIMPLKACTVDSCPSSEIVAALDYATRNGADVVNGSFGGAGASQAEQDAIQRGRERGILFVFPAGNAAEDTDAAPFYPASYPAENILSVAATDNRDALADFSSYGGASVDLAAPGVGILSTGASAGREPVAVRVESPYRSTYAGFGLEQISGAEARADFLSRALADLSTAPTDPILLVDDDGGASYEEYYREAFSALGYGDVAVNEVAPGSDGPDAAEMRDRTVVWLTGSEYENTLREADLAGLAAHLDGGGKLLLMGQDIGYDIGGGRPGSAPADFYAQYLKARLLGDDFDPESVSGTPGGVFGDDSYRLSGGDSAGYEGYVDRLGYAPGASAALLSDAAPVTYTTMSGTSMAAPHVSGTAALLASRAPSAGYGEIKTAILDAADDTPSLQGRVLSGGRLDAAAALERLDPTPEPAKLALRASGKVVPYGGTVTLTGRLADLSGERLSGQEVTVWRSNDGGESWRRNGSAEYLPLSADYRASRSLTSNATFQLRFAGSETHEAAVSRPVSVKARAYLSRPATPRLVERGEPFVTRGVLRPAHAGKTGLIFERYSLAGGWKVRDRAWARNVPKSGYSSYSLRHRLPSPGVWRVKAYHVDDTHAATWSPARRFLCAGRAAGRSRQGYSFSRGGRSSIWRM